MWELKFKRKPKTEFKEPAAYVPLTEEHAPGIPKQLTDYSNHISNLFNKYCTEMGVECVISMDPKDCRRVIIFRVVGDRDVKIEYDQKVHYLAPGEYVKIHITDRLMRGELPQLTLLPYGNAATQQNANPLQDGVGNITGWQKYKVYPSVQTAPGLQRQYFRYGGLSGMDGNLDE